MALISEEENGYSHHQEPVSIREDLIKTAVDFLMIPKVAGSSVEKKRNFLRSKGLTEVEIDLAFNRSGFPSSPDYDSFNEIYSSQITSRSSWSNSLARFSFSTLIFSGICYGGFQLFKKYIQPRVQQYFSDRLNTIDSKLDKMMESIKKLENDKSLEQLRQNIQSIKTKSYRPEEIQELKTEISSVKALILSKNQFALNKPSTDATIPSWQLDEPITNGDKAKPSPLTTESDNNNLIENS